MIKSLSISNYALIEKLDINPSENLSIITGETGAGKSIMLGALGLLMGKRADTKILWDETSKCLVEATFDIKDYDLEKTFDEYDLDYSHESIIRREITPNGKSRAFVNDTPVTLDVLKFIGGRLMDIHSQHESLHLNDNLYQLIVLDSYSGHSGLITEFREKYNAYTQASKNYHTLVQLAKKSSDDEDYKKFILNELIEVGLDGIDVNELENELNILENAEEIKSLLNQSDQLIDQSDYSINNAINELFIAVKKLSSLSGAFQEYSDRIDSLLIELKDIHSDLLIKNDQVVFDPEKKDLLKSQIDEIFRLQKKHSISDIADLIRLRDRIEEELSLVANLDEEIDKAKNSMDEAYELMMVSGETLSQSRKKNAEVLAREISMIIHEIGIENGRLDIKINENEPSIDGLDHVEILFSANKGIPTKEIKYVASGGEFSRLIFAIKYLIADKTALPTIFFDEIDTGVSGEVAHKMVRMMKRMAKNHQVISISHLPQFAAGGDQHFYVFKDHQGKKTITRIKLLKEDERVEQIAKMIGGNNPTNMAFESAKELLSQPS